MKKAKKTKKTSAKEPVETKAIEPEPAGEVVVPKHGLTQHQYYLILVAVTVLFAGLMWYAYTSASPTAPGQSQPLAFSNTASQATNTTLIVIKDETCAVCNSGGVESMMKTLFSGITTKEINSTTPEAQSLIPLLGLRALPAYVLESSVENEENFSELEPTLVKKGNVYYVDERVRGLIVRYSLPPSTEDEPSTNPSAPVTIIEFSDPACSACKSFNLKTKPMLEKEYGNKINIVFKSMPLSPDTVNASVMMDCAAEQNNFWEYAGLVYSNTTANMSGYAPALRLNTEQFNNCTNNQASVDKVMADRAEGVDYGVTGVPTLFINGIRIIGVPSYADLKKIIDRELS